MILDTEQGNLYIRGKNSPRKVLNKRKKITSAGGGETSIIDFSAFNFSWVMSRKICCGWKR